jgi:hypothetical protein
LDSIKNSRKTASASPPDPTGVSQLVIQAAEIDYNRRSQAAQTSFTENHVGLPLKAVRRERRMAIFRL